MSARADFKTLLNAYGGTCRIVTSGGSFEEMGHAREAVIEAYDGLDAQRDSLVEALNRIAQDSEDPWANAEARSAVAAAGKTT